MTLLSTDLLRGAPFHWFDEGPPSPYLPTAPKYLATEHGCSAQEGTDRLTEEDVENGHASSSSSISTDKTCKRFQVSILILPAPLRIQPLMCLCTLRLPRKRGQAHKAFSLPHPHTHTNPTLPTAPSTNSQPITISVII